MSVLEIVFVGQCEVLVRLGFVQFSSFFFPWLREHIPPSRPMLGIVLIKYSGNVNFSDTYPLKYRSRRVT